LGDVYCAEGHEKVNEQCDAAVAADPYLAGFVKEVAPRVSGFPTRIDKFELLVDVSTMFIFTASVQHSAVNYLQMLWQGYLPMAPPTLNGRWIKAGENVNEKFYIAALPGYVAESFHRKTLAILSQPTHKPITESFGSRAKEYGIETMITPLSEFQRTVHSNTQRIKQRNQRKEVGQSPWRVYAQMEGDKIANSIEI
jgi:hypothetical protein